jgi:hypothetical protein
MYHVSHITELRLRLTCTCSFWVVAAIAVVNKEGIAVVGSLGDAGAVVCMQGDDSDTYLGRLVSASHTASDPDEQERIERDFPDKVHFTHDGCVIPLCGSTLCVCLRFGCDHTQDVIVCTYAK